MGTRKPMLRERSHVEHPLWRKKVDFSLFGHRTHGGTTIPHWLWSMWHIEDLFGECASERDPRSKVGVHFEGQRFDGHVTLARKGRENTPICRLWLPTELCSLLRLRYPMSYLRGLERALTDDRGRDVEVEIPFWEFLDIEFDPDGREFVLTAYYTQRPLFPLLFEHLIPSSMLQAITGAESGD